MKNKSEIKKKRKNENNCEEEITGKVKESILDRDISNRFKKF